MFSLEIKLPMHRVTMVCVEERVCRDGEWQHLADHKREPHSQPYEKRLAEWNDLNWEGVAKLIKASWNRLQPISEEQAKANGFCPLAEQE